MSKQRTGTADMQSLEARITARAWKDPAFRRQLINDPKATLEKEFSVRLPEGLECKVVEETPRTTYLVLPVFPGEEGPDQLSDSELESVAGGAPSKTNVMSGCICCGIKPPR